MVQRLTPCPEPVPTRANPTDFDPNADNMMSWFPTMSSEYNVGAGQIETAQDSCSNSATAAAASAIAATATAGATEYSAVTSYDYPDVVICTDGNSYRCVGTAVVGQNPITDDGTYWTLLTGTGSGVWKVKSNAYTAVDQDRLIIDTTSSSVVITLPLNPIAGATRVWFKDAGETFNSTTFLGVARNGLLIMGLAEDMNVRLPGVSFSLLYTSVAYGWDIIGV